MTVETAWLQVLANTKDPDLAPVVGAAVAEPGLLDEILDGLTSEEDLYRYNCFKPLSQIADDQPWRLCPQWDRFAGLLDSDNAYHRAVAVRLLAKLTTVDAENRFERLFDRYFAPLDDRSVMTARYLAQSAGEVARSVPYLQSSITDRLLAVDRTAHPQGRRDLIKADILASFGDFFDASRDKGRIRAFFEEQLECSSPKTRKVAKAFLDKFDR